MQAKTASMTAKSIGLKSLGQVSDITGKSRATLNKWFNEQPDFFYVVILGCQKLIDLQPLQHDDQLDEHIDC